MNLKMNPDTAATIVAIRPAIEQLIIKAANDPESITELSVDENQLIEFIKILCTFDAGRYGLEKINLHM